MSEQIQVLDEGYVELIDCWGSDERIIEAARMSTGKGFNGWGPIHDKSCEVYQWHVDNITHDDVEHYTRKVTCTCTPKPGDEKLLAYLYNNKHSTPFEMAGMTIEVKAPIFVYREWHRHRTQSYNEMSARYIPLPDENYVPTVDRMMISGGTNKQARSASDVELTESAAKEWLMELEEAYALAQQVYERGIKIGIPKEVARLPVPVARYSRMRASANLRNWLGFLALRMDSHAQWEIRMYANVVGQLIAEKFPHTWELFAKEKGYK